ncbi:MAG: hotdog fold domain-containing protein [Bacteroidota bacterium]
MNSSIVIDKRFCGPPNSGNGGYVCGMVDRQTPYQSEVTLRKPPPLDLEMKVQWADNQVQVVREETLIAAAREGAFSLEAPAIPSFKEAREASKDYLKFQDKHSFPTCFVCGPDRKEGDGLRIFPGLVAGTDTVAAPWIPFKGLEDASGAVSSEYIWAALDCPGAFALMHDRFSPMVLGRMSCEILHPIYPGEQCVVIGWPNGADGKKLFSGTAVYNEKQELCAIATAIWFRVDLAKFEASRVS